jgi:hypothetical protein
VEGLTGDDLISRQEALDALALVAKTNYVLYVAQYARRALKNLPAVDASPVVHGRWKAILNPFWDAECSECGYAKKTGWEWGFCPNCGAKMDGGTEL